MSVLHVETDSLTLAQVDESLALLAGALPDFDRAERELALVSVDRLLELRYELLKAEG